jgi:hypothetical protein
MPPNYTIGFFALGVLLGLGYLILAIVAGRFEHGWTTTASVMLS